MAKILIIGAGVIGSVYGAKLIKSGNDVSFLARGSRLEFLMQNGLQVKWLKGEREVFPNIRSFSEVPYDESFDFVMVTVRNENLHSVYPLLHDGISNTIIFMVNNPEGSKEYSRYISKEKLIIGFPGAGGEIREGILHGHIVSGFVQPTTIGRVDGIKDNILLDLKKILRSAGFSVSINENMDSWLINHLAMVCPLGNAIYAGGGDNYTASKNQKVMKDTAIALKEAFRFVRQTGIGINPSKNNVYLYLPTGLLSYVLKKIFSTQWANTVIANHSLKAQDEMKRLTEGFLKIANQFHQELPHFEKLARFNKSTN